MSESKPKLSPITGKSIQFRVLEIIGHLQLDSYFFVTLENEVHDVLAIRDIYGIKGWIKEKKELIAAVKKMNIEICFTPITSPLIVKKEGNEFEFYQKGSMFVVIGNEHEYLFVRELLMENGIYFTVYDQ